MEIKNIKEGDIFEGIVKITSKFQPGPVIFEVTDGTGFIEAVTRESTFNTNDVVKIKGQVGERNGKLRIELKAIYEAKTDFDEIIDKKAEPKDIDLSIKSDKLETLKPYFLKIAKKIRKTILSGEPILIRHHADTDGITAGLAIEKSCKLLMEEIGIEPKHTLFRSPSKAPFYEVMDVFKDISFTKRMLEGHGQNKPLILVLDNGSTPEDVFAMKTLHSLGFEIIVIDHHNPVVLENKKTAVCPYVDLHVNPYMEGFDGNVTAGMLCYEIARLINNNFENKLLPAMSCIGDRSSIDEAKEYLKNSGIDESKVRQKVIAMDYIAYNMKFDAGKGVYEQLFENNNFVNLLNEEVNKGVETQLQSTLPYLRTQELNGVIFSYIDLEKYTVRFTYPTPGKVIGMIHDNVAEDKHEPVITIGYLSDMIILRATKPVLPIAKIIENLQQKFPEANVDGGGHEMAGTIKFVSAHLNVIIENIKEQIKGLKVNERNE